MTASGLQYFPVAWPFLIMLAVLLGIAAGIVAVNTLRFASAAMGIGPGSMLALLLLALIGSYVNIPVAYLPAREVTRATVVQFFGIQYVVPLMREVPSTVIAVNVGGAIIPTVLSLYLIAKNRILGLSVIGVAIVAVVCHQIARPVRGLGIAEPVFIPPLITAVVAVLLSRRYAAPLAYISGSLGTLIGADLLNLGKVQGLGAPIASIGGAGTFDGIFVTGLLALLYASFGVHLGASETPRRSRRER
ncbi:MAG TPA: DUF1614 domain-containing protein [Steroidobacteraceae bacterium]|nr:DUF1614 domain-containing protein [Steroidobacteraceae bacterium]